MRPAVQVENLVQRYGAVTAVDGICFRVKPGEIFGILGPNGAGKTTTLEIIEGLQKPERGRVFVLGMDLAENPSQIKARIGVQLQASSYYDHLSLSEILSLLGSFYPKRMAAGALLEQVGLSGKAGRRVKQLSGGERQRFAFAASLVNDPELVVLDEPTTGLDPQARRDLWSLVAGIRERGTTVLLTTHYIEEAESMCDRVAIMDRGRILALDSPSKLVDRGNAQYTVRLATAGPLDGTVMERLQELAELVQATGDNSYLLRTGNDPRTLQKVLGTVADCGAGLDSVRITPVTLEDVFLQLTGREFSDADGGV